MIQNQLRFFDENKEEIVMEYGFNGIGLEVPSPSYTTQTIRVPGRGTIVVDKQLDPRPITARFLADATEGGYAYYSRLNQQFELYALLGNGKVFYVEHYEHRNSITLGVVWKCHLDGWEPENIGQYVSTFSIPMTCMSGTAETLLRKEETFTTSDFTLLNEGTVIVDPRKHDGFEIEFQGASTNLTITNNTTGDVWKYNGSTTAFDKVLIKGIRSLKNGTGVFGETNKKLITLAIGDNNFTVTGTSGAFELTIRTNFYYL